MFFIQLSMENFGIYFLFFECVKSYKLETDDILFLKSVKNNILLLCNMYNNIF